MARAYSNDLRRKILEAYGRGSVSLEELAQRFGVSHGYTKKIRKQQLRTWIGEQPDLTLAELQQRLRSAKARTLEVLEEAVAQALASITAQNASAWFRHCGYAIH